MPTSASARTGPSLRPSPTIATTRSLGGADRARPAWPPAKGRLATSSIPTVAAIRRAACARSPVNSVTSSPRPRSCRDRRPRLGKRRIVERQHRVDPLAPADIDHANARSPPATARARQRRRKRPAELAHQGAVPGRHRLAVGVAADAAAGHGPNIAGRRPARCRARRPPRRWPAPSHARNGAPDRPPVPARRRCPTPSRSMPTRRGLPDVSVPVLSKASNRAAAGPRARPGRGRGSRAAPAGRCRARSPSARRGRRRRDRRRPAPRGRSAAPGRTAVTAPR